MKQATVEYLQLNTEMAELIQKIGRGDQSALKTLYDKTGPLLFGLVSKILEDRTSAEEVLLDVYTRVWKQAASYDPKIFAPLEWLIMIARSHAIANLNWNRQSRKVQRFTKDNAKPEMTVMPEQQELVRGAIASLVPTQQEVLDSAFYSGLSCSEIAAQTMKPVGAIKTHARLGLSKLAELFRPLFGPEI